MEKTKCDECARRFQCNTMDRRRGMACIDFKEKEKSNERKIQTVDKG